MKKIRGNNPVFLIISLIVPWRYLNTYYYLENGTLYISRYYASKVSKRFKREVVRINIKDIQKIGFNGDFENEAVEATLQGVYGKYEAQEIVFILKDDMAVGWNCRGYTKQQITQLLKFQMSGEDIIFGTKLRKALEISTCHKKD
ncbi:hypothetical protein [Enterococcus sp. BWR-S5]|uniref:hypothetical protein n=1 Tax=Enterococcus sp. BWR-S5 TaxID=2787714 RepID=UPI0019216329|nr:hypothetical protein [Enterococcus sp. BWR-S5]MBL1226402.1 hypothetical protein [Enterococcus sp. BWR-S5]